MIKWGKEKISNNDYLFIYADKKSLCPKYMDLNGWFCLICFENMIWQR